MSDTRGSHRWRRVLASGVAVLLLAAIAALGDPAAIAAGSDAVVDTGTDTGTDYGRMILVLDSSGSMKEPTATGEQKIEVAKRALHEVVGQLPEDADVGLRVYGAKVFSHAQKGACTDSQLVVRPGTGNRDRLDAAIDDYAPYGETPIAYALRQAAKDIGREGTRSIVLVSDGEATCPPDPCVVAGQLASAGIDLQIDVVGLDVSGSARTQLRCIAARGHGTYYDADSADEISSSLTTVAERAVRPFRIDGRPIEGGRTAAHAEPLEAGRYAGEINQGERWFRYHRKYADSTVIASAYDLQPGALSDVHIDVTTPDADICLGGATPILHPVFTGYAQVISADDCPGDLLIKASRRYGGDRPAPFGLSVLEEPAVTDADSLPPGLEAIDGAKFVMPKPTRPFEKITAGSTFEDAAALDAGHTYSTSIVPGEVQAFRVHVGWGQRLAVRVDRPALKGEAADVVGLTDYFHLQLMNPVRATVDDEPRGADLATSDTGSDRNLSVEGTIPVRWRNREHGGSASYLAGDYYVLYAADFSADRSIEIPYRITAEVQGTEGGAPEYAEGEEPLVGPTASPAAGPDSTGSDRADSDRAGPGLQQAQDSEDDSGLPAGIRIGGAALLVLAAAACVVGARRLLRRSRT